MAPTSEALFQKYCGLEREVDGETFRIGTQRVVIERDICGRAAELIGDLLPSNGKLLVVVDSNTWEVAGDEVAQSFVTGSNAREVDRLFVIEPRGHVAVTDDANIDFVRQHIVDGGYVGVVAVGSGTVNDIAKMASYQADVPYAVVGTAPSMNGYTSAIAAILSNGVKTTQPCHVPVAVLCDLDVMAEAPYRMIASGLGDLLSKPVSNADWRLGARLADAYYTRFPLEMIEAAHAALDGVPVKLPERDRDAVRGLCEAICLSGMAMAAVGTSSPASGGEHLISHYIDMVAIAQDAPHDFHGCQVGVGTITTAAIYERLLALDPTEIDIETCVSQHPPWSAYRRTVVKRFERYDLVDAVLEHAEANYPDQNALRIRLHELVNDWDDLVADVSTTLEGHAAIRKMLVDAKAPYTYAEIGVDPERARDAILHSKDIRARYTVLDLASEIGRLERWTEQLLAPGFGLLAR